MMHVFQIQLSTDDEEASNRTFKSIIMIFDR